MIRKLAVTVFALSFAVLGCGSDEGGGKKDAAALDGGRDSGPGAEVQTNVPDGGPKADVLVVSEVQPATEAGPTGEVNKPVDVAPGTEAGPVLDTAKLEGGSDVSIVPDTSPAVDTTPAVDVASID